VAAQWLVDGVTALAWAVVAYKLPSLLRSPKDPARRSYWLSLFAMAAALTVLLPQVYLWLDRVTAVPNLSRLLGDSLGIVAAWAGQSLLLYANYPVVEARPRSQRLSWALVAVLAAMAVCFALAPAQPEDRAFTGHYAHVPAILAYRLIFLGWLGVAMVNFTRLSWRYAHVSLHASLRAGFRLVAVGGVLGLGYVANEVLRSGATYLNVADPLPAARLSQLLIAGFMATGLIGTTMPAWGPHAGIPALVDWLHRYHSLRRLYPLWRALYQASPQIALFPPVPFLADILAWRKLEFRLQRRVVEIRDGQLMLRPYRHPAAIEYARELCANIRLAEEEAAFVLEATDLAVALQMRAAGRVMGSVTPTPLAPVGADLDSEAAALERVARCYRHSPLVQAVLARLQPDCVPTPLTVGKA
jgi:hypothetical protein